jgi:hypothetical protein
MNLCGDRNTASLPAMSTRTYGAAAAKSQNDSAPCRCSSADTATVLLRIPVTLLAAENEPIRSGRSAYPTSSASSRSRSM